MNLMMKQYNTRTRYLLFFLLGLVGLLSSCQPTIPSNSPSPNTATLPFYQEATFTPHWLSPRSEELEDFHKIPNFSLTNQNGELITQNTVANKIYVVDFFFTTCPGICPKMTSNMSILQDTFLKEDDILLLSHSVMPETDSVSRLANYAQRFGILDSKWHLLTGDRKQIYTLGRYAYFVEENLGLKKSADDFLHTENFVLIDKNRYIRGIYNGLNRTAIQQLIEDIRTLKKEEKPQL